MLRRAAQNSKQAFCYYVNMVLCWWRLVCWAALPCWKFDSVTGYIRSEEKTQVMLWSIRWELCWRWTIGLCNHEANGGGNQHCLQMYGCQDMLRWPEPQLIRTGSCSIHCAFLNRFLRLGLDLIGIEITLKVKSSNILEAAHHHHHDEDVSLRCWFDRWYGRRSWCSVLDVSDVLSEVQLVCTNTFF